MEWEAADNEDWLSITPELGIWRDGCVLAEPRLRLWSLVLEARDIPCRAEKTDDGWLLLVPADYFITARNELRLFDEESRGWPPPRIQTPPLKENALSTLSVLLLLATFYNITRLDIYLPNNQVIDWHNLGSGNAGKIVAGEWWRLVTALTLHVNVAHLLANLAIGGFFIILLCRELGAGLAWGLILASGILGNLVNALLQQSQHTSIGASTAIFGAVGILATINLVHHRHPWQKRRLVSVAAALSLLAILGTEGENTDLGAHFFGFMMGLVSGLAAERFGTDEGLPGRKTSVIFASTSALVVIISWWRALAAP